MTQLDPKALEAAARAVAWQRWSRQNPELAEFATGNIMACALDEYDAQAAITAYLAAMREAGTQALAVALWERDPDMAAPSEAIEKAEGIIAALRREGFMIAAAAEEGD